MKAMRQVLDLTAAKDAVDSAWPSAASTMDTLSRAVAAHREALKKAAFAAEELWKAANEMPSGANKQANRERVEALARFARRAEKLVSARAALEKANVFITDSIVMTCEAVMTEDV
jgi:hypothetical protein